MMAASSELRGVSGLTGQGVRACSEGLPALRPLALGSSRLNPEPQTLNPEP